MKVLNERGPDPQDVPMAHIHTVEVESAQDARHEETMWTHFVPHPFKGYVIAQIFDARGRHLLLPGVGPAWCQKSHGVTVPVISYDYYPLTVVMIG